MLKRWIAGASFTLILAAGGLKAQTRVYITTIDHEFSVRHTKMPAGRYRIEMRQSPDVIVLKSLETRKSVNLLRGGLQDGIHSLDFRPADNQWVLSRVR
jgi:hypothetical protein